MVSPHFLSSEERDAIIKAYLDRPWEGLAPLSHKFQRHRTTIFDLLVRAGIEVEPLWKHRDRDLEIVQRYSDGEKVQDIIEVIAKRYPKSGRLGKARVYQILSATKKRLLAKPGILEEMVTK
tara:strand:- start:170 stop:535 length:366 start_codon:yes stop_codon:yes gene_type:complete